MISGGWHPAAGVACAPMFQPGRVWTGISRTPPELLAQALSDPEDDNPAFRIRAMPDQDDSRNAVTTPAPPPSEPTTRTENDKPEPRDAIAPPARMPDTQELGGTALAATEAPEWFKASFIGQALTSFADDARALREGRAQQHAEVLAKLDEQGAKQDDAARLVLELGANLDLLTGEFKLFRDACEKRLAEGDERFRSIERKVSELEARFAKMLEQHVAELLQEAIRPFVTEFAEIRQLVADLRSNVTARQTPAPSGT